MKLFSAIWLTGTVIWYVISESVDCAAHRYYPSTTPMLLAAAVQFLLLFVSSRTPARGILILMTIYAVIGIVLSFIAMLVLSLALPFCPYTLA